MDIKVTNVKVSLLQQTHHLLLLFHRIIIPEHAEVANAVGAAIPSVAGVVDTLLPAASGTERQAQIQAAVQQAVAAAVAAGVYLCQPTQCLLLLSTVFLWQGQGGVWGVVAWLLLSAYSERGLRAQSDV